MEYSIICLLLFSVVVSLQCSSDTVYMKYSKKSGTKYANEESFEILIGNAIIYTSPTFANNELRVVEHCLNSTDNQQYTLKLKDSNHDSWYISSWLMIEGEYGNRVFKNYMTESSEETYVISLYYGIKKNASWKMSLDNVSGGWIEYSFSDSAWTTVTLGSIQTVTGNTQYFRKTFVGLPNMAAYELSMNYRFGIIAYLNGVEVHRDNMPSGPVSSTTPATGSYSSVEYRSIIRPGGEIQENAILAVEIHLMSSEEEIDFNCYLALNTPSTQNSSCFIYPYDITISVTGGSNKNNAFDFGKTTYYSIGKTILPATMTFALSSPYAMINSLRYWPYGDNAYTPNTFIFSGTNDIQGDEWTSLIDVSDHEYTYQVYSLFHNYFSNGVFSTYKMDLLEASDPYIYLYEIQLCTCNTAIPTSIEFKLTNYEAYVHSEFVSIRPIIGEFINCSISPSPAESLSFDTQTCTLSGYVKTISSTQYTVSSTINGNLYQGSFTLSGIECSGTLVDFLRVYRISTYPESFSVVDAITQDVVLDVYVAKIATEEKSHVVCLSGSKYIVNVDGGVTYWQPNSFLYVNAILHEKTDYETILRINYDAANNLPTAYVININYSVSSYSSWYYKMGEVPSNWYSSDTSGWLTASAESFPNSTNQIQLYKKSFSVSSLEAFSGVVFSLKYQYGVIIYLNNNEVFRKGIVGDLSVASLSSVALNDVKYRQISLPIKKIGSDETRYIVQGENTVAIALVASTSTSTTSSFDCAIRLMGAESSSRIWDYSVESNGIVETQALNSLNNNCISFVTASKCENNYIQITFNNDRHEWISSATIKLVHNQIKQYVREFTLYAKNAEDTEWTLLKNVTTMNWSQAGQRNHIWINNNKSYNMYRFENFRSGDPTTCSWRFNTIDLRSDNTQRQLPPLQYESLSVYKDIEISEIYPNSNYYADFSIVPSLPLGLSMDPNTGVISGTVHEIMEVQVYTITAYPFNTYQLTTASFTLDVTICHGGKSLITIVTKVDSTPVGNALKVYKGKDTSGSVIHHTPEFTDASAVYYTDLCLNHDIYTAEFIDSGSGWAVTSGYYLTVDVGQMIFDSGYVYNGGTSPTSVTTMFSSYLPFQIDYDDWKLFKNNINVDKNWNKVEYDDSQWAVTKAADIGTSESVTVYLRKSIDIPDINDYHILNSHIRYVGGVVAYFNGRKVARFNLVDTFTSLTESIDIHSSTVFSKFHVILSTVSATTGKNIIAFEIHRPIGRSSSEPVVFDATGVFGVNSCSVVLDTVYDVISSRLSGTTDVNIFFNMLPTTIGTLTSSLDAFFEWSIENLEGSKFNAFAMLTSVKRTSLGFSIYGRDIPDSDTDPTSLFATVEAETIARGRPSWSVPVGIAGYGQLRWEMDDTPSGTLSIAEVLLMYCKPSGTGTCEGIGDYPPVGEGDISPGECEEGYRGYSYRECINGQLGEIKTDKCTYKLPAMLAYDKERYVVVIDALTEISQPTYFNIIHKFYLEENQQLPTGLILDEVTGAITGTTVEASDLQAFTIYGENPAGVVSTVIHIMSRKGECKADGNFPKTDVGEVAVFECSQLGSYLGTQKRECVLGDRDGIWQKTNGTCISLYIVLLLSFIGIIVVVIIVFIIIRTSKKKAVGGVRGKKAVTMDKAKKRREVKV